MPEPERIEADLEAGTVRICGRASSIDAVAWDVPTRGSVYGTLLNYCGALAALGAAVNAPPYQAPPRAPVLYVKPKNTWIGHGAPIPMPGSIEAVEIGAALGVVIGTTACRVMESRALDCVAGYTIVGDVCEPHASLDRPAIRQRCRDGFCPIGPWVMAKREVPFPDALEIRVFINGELRASNTTAKLIRPVARLIADVTEFMTLFPGDVLLTGVAENAPRATAGEQVRIEIDGIGALENRLVAEARP